jgi:homoserine dehydrogenase
MLSNEHPLAGVNGVMNAIFVKGNVLGDVMFYGAGAGKLPTASAVVSDVVEAVKYIDSNVVTIWDTNKATLVKAEEVASRFFVRISGDASERLAEVTKAFGKGEVVTVDGVTGEFAYVTEAITEKEYATAAAGLDGIISMIRYEK